MAEVSPGSLLSGTLASFGASAVARTSDRGRVAEVQPIYRSVRGSQSGVPLLTPKMQAGQDSDGGGGGSTSLLY